MFFHNHHRGLEKLGKKKTRQYACVELIAEWNNILNFLWTHCDTIVLFE